MPVVSEPYAPGTPCWGDLMASDQQASMDFYRNVFGWEGEPGPGEFGGYAIMTLKGKPVAGIGPAMGGDGQSAPVAWTTYLCSADADATHDKITKAGGTILAPVMDVGTTGRMLIAADPAGAVFGIWQPVDFSGAQIVNEAGAVVWNELSSSDKDAAAAFYQDVLGVTVAAMEGAGGYSTLNVDGRAVAGLQGLDHLPPGTPSNWATYFAVDDVDATADTAVKAGASVMVPPFDGPPGRMAALADPQGAFFWIIKPGPQS